MSGEQLELFPERSEVGEECAYFDGYLAGHVRCMRGATPTYTNCNESFCGEPPKCVFAPLDNSDAAMRRRREWMKRNGYQSIMQKLFGKHKYYGFNWRFDVISGGRGRALVLEPNGRWKD